MYLSQIIKYAKNSKLISGSIYVVVGNQIANLFAYLYHVFVGRILGPIGYGELAALLALLYIISVPSEGLRLIVTKYYSVFFARNQLGQAKHLYLRITKTIIVIGLIGLVITFPFYETISQYLNIKEKSNFLWVYITFAVMLQNSLNVGALFGYQMFLQSTILNNITIIIRLIIGIGSAFFGVVATVAGNTLSSLIGVLCYLLPLQFILRAQSEKTNISKKDLLNYSIPTMLATLGLISLYSTDVVMVKHFFPSYEAGIYASVAVLGKIIFFASNSFGLILFPIIAHKWELKASIDKEFFIALLAVISISLIISTVFFLFPQLVVNMLFGSKYSDAENYLGLFAVFITFFSMASLFMNTYLAIGRTNVWIFMVAAAIIQIIGIQLFHSSLIQVINVNILVSGALFVFVLIYYPYAKRRLS